MTKNTPAQRIAQLEDRLYVMEDIISEQREKMSFMRDMMAMFRQNTESHQLMLHMLMQQRKQDAAYRKKPPSTQVRPTPPQAPVPAANGNAVNVVANTQAAAPPPMSIPVMPPPNIRNLRRAVG